VVIASVALVTSMGVFASLGGMRRHEDVPPTWTAAPPAVATVVESNDCTCTAAPTVQVDTATPAEGTQTTVTTSSDDCTCTANPAADPTVQTQTVTTETETPAVQTPESLTIDSSAGSSTTNVTVGNSSVVVQTTTTTTTR
jgi:hypothetical protein